MTGTTTKTSPPSTPPTSEDHAGLALPSGRRRTRRRILVVFALLVAAFVFLLVEGLGSSLNYFDTVNQAYAHRATLGTTTLRLEGTVDQGTIHPTAKGTNFDISQGDRVVHVVNTGNPPQLFQVNIPVVVEGHFTSATSREFVSDSILVKHSANYIEQHPGRVRAKNGTVR